jgi:hypothetical protein
MCYEATPQNFPEKRGVCYRHFWHVNQGEANFNFARLFIRQTIGLGGEQEDVPDDQLTLAGKQDVSRLTFTIGRFSPLDICDNNTYARDPHMQFMNWAMMGNIAWDYGQDTIGYSTGIAVELNQPKWALRYGFFQMPADKNGFTGDEQYLMYPPRGEDGPLLRSWAMMTEFERRYSIDAHPRGDSVSGVAQRSGYGQLFGGDSSSTGQSQQCGRGHRGGARLSLQTRFRVELGTGSCQGRRPVFPPGLE